MKRLEKRDKKTFLRINELVAKTSPMRTHYNSENKMEKWIWGKKKILIKEMLKGIQYKSVIDIGCGDGGLFPLVDKNAKYTGIDVSPTQLRDFKKSLNSKIKIKPKLVLGDVANLPFKDNSFDVAIVCDVLEHVIDPVKVIKEIKRVVKPRGYVIFSIPNEYLLELSRLVTFRFPLRSPDHIFAIEVSDVKKYFSQIVSHAGIPFSLPAQCNLLNVLLTGNEEK